MRKAPAPVTVHCAVGVFWLPYSSGKRNCRSDEQKCEPANAMARLVWPPQQKRLPISSDSAAVEQAPYRPRKGIFSSLTANVDAVHWLSRSPPRMRSISSGFFAAFFSSTFSVRCTISLSAFSQLSSPK